jgi:hypothetical protein
MSQLRIRRANVFIAHIERFISWGLNDGYGRRDDLATIVLIIHVAANPDRLAVPSCDWIRFSAMRCAKVEAVGLNETAAAMAASNPIRNLIVLERAGRDGGRMQRTLIQRLDGVDRLSQPVSRSREGLGVAAGEP